MNKIKNLYLEINTLINNGSDRKDQKVVDLFQKLRVLQNKEAKKIREFLEAQLGMPIDAGRKTINDVEAIIDYYERKFNGERKR